VHPNLVPCIKDAARLVGIDLGADGRNEEAGRNFVAPKHAEHTRNPDPTAKLTPGEPPDRSTSGSEFETFVIAVERHRECAASTIGPG
jgi:hypothetical protein